MRFITLIASVVLLQLAINADGWWQTAAIGLFVPTVVECACQCVAERLKG